MKYKILFIIIIISIQTYSEVQINPKIKFKTNLELSNINKYKKGSSLTEVGYTDYLLKVKDYDEEAEIFSYKLTLEESDLKLVLNLEMYESFGNFLDKPSSVYPIIDIRKWDQNLPYEAYINYKWLTFGRKSQSWGPGRYGNLIVSDFSKYYDFLGIDKKFDRVRFRYMLSSMNSYLTSAEEKRQAEDWDGNSSKIFDERIKLFVAHRLEIELTENLILGISEGEMIGGKVPEFNMINPLYIYHSSYTEGYSNVLAGVDLEYILPKFETYFSFVIDDWDVADEGEDYKPKAIGYQYGLEKQLSDFNINFEYTRTSKWLYNRWQEYLKFTNRRLMTSTYGNSGRYVIDYPIGYYLGPDSEDYHFEISRKNINLLFQFMQKGEKNLRSNYEEADEEWFELDGIIEKRYKIKSRWEKGGFYIENEYIKIDNYENQDGVDKGIFGATIGGVFRY